MAEIRYLTNERLVQCVLDPTAPTADEIVSLAHELRWRREQMRADSRTAKQLKKVRAAIEAATSRIDAFEARWPDDEPLICCPRFSWGDGTHDLDCRGPKEATRG